MNLLGKRESVAGLAAQVRSAAVGSAAATGGFSQRRGLLVTDSAESEDALGTAGGTPALLSRPGIYQADAAAFEIGGVARGQSGIAGAGDGGDLCV
jgi:hypothetical protein